MFGVKASLKYKFSSMTILLDDDLDILEDPEKVDIIKVLVVTVTELFGRLSVRCDPLMTCIAVYDLRQCVKQDHTH